MSSMESAPATMPATREAIFAPALAPLSPVMLNRSWAKVDRLAASAKCMVGTSPASEMRLGSSKDADIAVGLCNNCTCEVPFWQVNQDSKQA